MKGTVNLGSTVVATKEHIACDLSGEAAILNLNNGVYYGLDAVGARIWQLIQAPVPVREVRDALLESYEVEADRCERDLLELLSEMAEQGLVEVEDAPAVDTGGAQKSSPA